MLQFIEELLIQEAFAIFRENQRNIRILTVLGDAGLLTLAMCLGYWLRFEVLRGEADHAALSHYLAVGAGIVPFFLLIYGLLGLYDNALYPNFQKQLERLVPANLIGTVLLLAAFFFLRSVDVSRLTVAFFFLIATLLQGLFRLGLRRVIRQIGEKGLYLRRVLLIGSGDTAGRYLSAAEQSESFFGIRVTGRVSEAPILGLPLHGSYDRLEEILLEGNFDEAVAALDIGETPRMAQVISACEKSGTKLSLLPFYHELLPARPYVDEVAGLPLISLRRIPLDNLANAFLKRLTDVLGALILIVLTAPLMLIAAAGTRLSSPGPVIFRQARVGLGKKPFVMYKFRSMRVNANQHDGWTAKDDPRRTAFGAFLRKTSIDELPQLFNVLRGDMSLVGPRPEVPHFVEQFRESVPLYMVKHQVRPGMTGWAQVCGLRGDTSIIERIRHDIWYIENWSLLLDLRILLLSPVCALRSPEKLVKPGVKMR